MLVLALDTSGSACSVALYNGAQKQCLAALSEPMDRGHAERLMEMINCALPKAGKNYSDIERVVTTTGPGSFTGIRVGLATARGIGLGLGIDTVGVSCLEVTSSIVLDGQPEGFSDRKLLIAQDARRGEAYYQLFDSKGNALGPASIGSHEFVAGVAEENGAAISGSASPLIADYFSTSPLMLDWPSSLPIERVASLGAQMEKPEARPEPLYIRKADAKPQSGFALKRQ